MSDSRVSSHSSSPKRLPIQGLTALDFAQLQERSKLKFNSNNTKTVMQKEENYNVAMENELDKQISCHICGKVFLGKNCQISLQKHLYRTHNDNPNAECNICFKTFQSRAHLYSHKRQVHSTGNLPNMCEHCDKTFISKIYLKKHTIREHPSPEESRECDECGKIYKSEIYLNIHKQRIHMKSPSKYTCDVCQRSFKVKIYLYNHISTMHAKHFNIPTSVHKCEVCGKTFTLRRNYKIHFLKMHKRVEKEQRCELCGFKKFKSENSFKQHVYRTHTRNNVKGHCDVCNKDYTTELRLKMHMNRVHTTSFTDSKCEYCEKSFKTIYRLRDHITNMHTSPKAKLKKIKIKPSCQFCGDVFNTKKLVAKHVTKYHNKKDCMIPNLVDVKDSQFEIKIEIDKTDVTTVDKVKSTAICLNRKREINEHSHQDYSKSNDSNETGVPVKLENENLNIIYIKQDIKIEPDF